MPPLKLAFESIKTTHSPFPKLSHKHSDMVVTLSPPPPCGSPSSIITPLLRAGCFTDSWLFSDSHHFCTSSPDLSSDLRSSYLTSRKRPKPGRGLVGGPRHWLAGRRLDWTHHCRSLLLQSCLSCSTAGAPVHLMTSLPFRTPPLQRLTSVLVQALISHLCKLSRLVIDLVVSRLAAIKSTLHIPATEVSQHLPWPQPYLSLLPSPITPFWSACCILATLSAWTCSSLLLLCTAFVTVLFLLVGRLLLSPDSPSLTPTHPLRVSLSVTSVKLSCVNLLASRWSAHPLHAHDTSSVRHHYFTYCTAVFFHF